jgi:hypothetical protein
VQGRDVALRFNQPGGGGLVDYEEPEMKRFAITYKQTGTETSEAQGKVTKMSENESKLND